MSTTKFAVGDHVRFLNATGGGIVRSVSANGIIGVEDPSGFIIPALATELVLVQPGSTIVPKVASSSSSNVPAGNKVSSPAAVTLPPAEHRERPTTSQGEQLNIHLAYLPEDPNQLGVSDYEVYLINDSNYDLAVVYTAGEGAQMQLLYQGVIPFDTQEFIEAFPPQNLPQRRRTQLQIIPFKAEGTFTPKQPYNIAVRVEGARFFKSNAFVANPFFSDGAILFPLVKNDVPQQQRLVDAEQLAQQMMLDKKHASTPPQRSVARKNDARQKQRVVDLHIHELLDSTTGMGAKEMLDVQLKTVRDTLNELKGRPHFKVIFIHGKGEGVLRKAILDLLRKEYTRFPVQDASFQEYGFGATQVTIR